MINRSRTANVEPPAEPTDQQPALPVYTEEEASAVIKQLAKLPTTFAGLPVKQPSEIAQHRGICLSLSGPGGVGKTTLSATVINSILARRALFVDIESGGHVLDDESTSDTYKPEEGPYLGLVEAKSWQDLENIMNQLVRNPGPFHCAIWDNMSEALELCKAKYNFYSNVADQLSKWNTITNDMVELFRKGRDMARNRQFVTIYCMWDTNESEDEMGTKFKHRGLHFNPKLAEKFTGIVDWIGWLETPDPPMSPYPPILHFDKSPMYPTKYRISPRTKAMRNVPEIIYNPDLGDIVDTVIGGKPWPTDKHKSPKRERPS